MTSPFDAYRARQTAAGRLVEAAIGLGLPVFPCGADKRPATEHGFKDASADPETIRRMFSAGGSMIGMPTGELTGIVAIDVDRKENRQGGDWLDANSHRMVQTRTIRTGTGGLHLYFRHPGQRVKNSQDRIAPGIDVRGDGGYLIVPPSPGYVVADDAPIADLPAWLLPVLCPPEPEHVPPAPRRVSSEGTAYGMAALQAECDAIRSAGWGTQETTLNTAALKIGGLIAGGELPASAAQDLVSAGRDMSSQPGKAKWTDADVREKVRRGVAAGTPRAAAPREEEPVHPAAAFLAKLHAKASKPVKVLPVAPGLMDVGGALGVLVAECVRTAIRPQPFLALGAAICAVGVLAGRRYRNQTDLRTNFYVAAIAESGGGKDHAPEIVRRCLGDAGLIHYLGGETLASGRGVLSSLAQHPARLFQVDELGLFLRTVTSRQAPGHKAEIWSELMKLYSRAKGLYGGTDYADQKMNVRQDLHSPHACFYGTTTPSTFWAALEGGAMLDGSLARFLVMVTDQDRPERNRVPGIFEPSTGLVEALQAVARGADGHDYGGNLSAAMVSSAPMVPYTVPMTPAADAAHEAKLDALEPWARDVIGTPKAAIVNRVGENAAKLGLLRAISSDPRCPVIGKADVAWGWALAEHCARSLVQDADRYLADSLFEQRLNKALEIIRRHGPCSTRDMFHRGFKLAERERREVIEALLSNGLIMAHAITHDGPGRPTTRYTALAVGSEAASDE